MKNLKNVLCVCIAASLVAGCTSGKKEETKELRYTSYNDSVQNFVNAIDSEYAYNLTYKLSYDESLGGSNGFRTSGSTYEHECADYLVSEMEKIGLVEIEKIPVTVDLWQFDDSSFTIEGTDIDFEPASYAQNGTDEDGITTQIVNVGSGLAADYEEVDVKGKIVLAGIDQRNEAWIDGYIQEASLHGAVALVTYDVGGYAQASDDIRNIQDVCTTDIMPTVSCTYNEGQKIIEAIENGKDTCTLKVDNTVVLDGGTSYTVAGKIKGKSSEKQIMYAGHYDKYFYGFQDDCAAISTVFTIAKAMIDSNYVPENDIVFVCHGAEEWGASGTQYDWTTGAWQTVNGATDWADKTIALYNFELSAFKEATCEQGFVSSVPEFNTFSEEFIENFGSVIDTKVYENGITGTTVKTQTMEDGVSYRFAGVPYMLNGVDFVDEATFAGQRYHSEYDDETTWSEDVLKLNVGWFGSMGIVTDQNPALELDLSQTANWLEETLDSDLAKENGYDVDAYMESLNEFKTLASDLYEKSVSCNDSYMKALKENDEDALKSLREEGASLTEKSLELFQMIQDSCMAVASSSSVLPWHEGYQNNAALLSDALAACEKEEDWTEDETGALDNLWQVNDMIAYDSVIFSKENAEKTYAMYNINAEDLFWGTGRIVEFVDVDDAIRYINEKGDFESAKPIIQKGYETSIKNLLSSLDKEKAGLDSMIQFLK